LLREDPLATSFHEGAHCVFAESFGLTVESVTCLSFSDAEGRSFCGEIRHNSDKVPIPAKLHIIHDLAGDIAEWPLWQTKPCCPGYMSSGDGGSLVETLKRIGVSSLVEAKRFYEDLFYEAEELVQKARPWIQALGIELYARKTMQGDEVRDLLCRVGFYENNPLAAFAKNAVLIGEQVSQYAASRQQQVEKVGEETVAGWEQEIRKRVESLSPTQQQELRESVSRLGLVPA
jgi:hypothetical protein